MASLFTHPALPCALKLAHGKVSRKLFWWSVALTILPDADVINHRLGVPYSSQWGHRGFTHSVIFALGLGLLSLILAKKLDTTRKQAFAWGFLSTVSHPLMDALTNGGMGVALWWPWERTRHFFAWSPVEVSPIGIGNFIGPRGIAVLLSEILWIWLPLLSLSLIVRLGKSKLFSHSFSS